MINIEFCQEFIRKHNIAVETLTELQLAEAFRQAIACGDFVRFVQVRTEAQQVVYLPYECEQRLRNRIKELEEQSEDRL